MKQTEASGGAQQGDEKKPAAEGVDFVEARRERQRQQEGEQDLYTGDRDPQALEEFAELAVHTFLGGLTRLGLVILCVFRLNHGIRLPELAFAMPTCGSMGYA